MLPNDKIQHYTDTFDELKSGLKWKVSDKKILMAIASTYVMNNKKLNLEKLIKLADEIKNRAGLFSSMKSYSRFTTAAVLDVHFENSLEQVPALFKLYDEFKKAKFRSGVFTYIAASILLTNHDNKAGNSKLIENTKDIYEGMKADHMFLTGVSDYPLAALLALKNRPDIIRHIEMLYEKLAKEGFRKGNDLQFLSHILSLDSKANVQDLVGRSLRITDHFREISIKPKAKYYSVIGMLALLPQNEVDISEISSMYQQLMDEKHFRWEKDMNVTMAVSFYVNDKVEHSSLTDASIRTTLEMILQAQQAVLVSTITATTVAANSNNGS